MAISEKKCFWCRCTFDLLLLRIVDYNDLLTANHSSIRYSEWEQTCLSTLNLYKYHTFVRIHTTCYFLLFHTKLSRKLNQNKNKNNSCHKVETTESCHLFFDFFSPLFAFILKFLNISSRLGRDKTAAGKSVELHLNLLYICDFWEYTQSEVCPVGHMLVDICWHLALISFLLVTCAKALSMSHSPQTSRASRLACTDTIHYRCKCHDRFAELQ